MQQNSLQQNMASDPSTTNGAKDTETEARDGATLYLSEISVLSAHTGFWGVL